MNPMLAEFVAESRDLLQQASEALLHLEQRFEQEQINRLFRAIHTIKGASGIFDIEPFTRTVHAAEDLLERTRMGRLELDGDVVDVILSAMDRVSQWLEELEQDSALSPDASDLAEALCTRLRAYLPSSSSEGPMASAPALSPPPAWLAALPPEVRHPLSQEAHAGTLWAITYTPSEGSFFSGTDPLLIVRGLKETRWLKLEERSPWPPLESLDPFLCSLAFQLIVCAEEATLREAFLYVAEEVELCRLAPAMLSAAPPAPDIAAPQRMAAVAILSAQAAVLGYPDPPDALRGRLGSVAQVLRRTLQGLGLDHLAPGPEDAEDAAALRRCVEAALDHLTDEQQDILQGPLAEAAHGFLREQMVVLRTPVAADLQAGRLAASARMIGHVLQSCRLRRLAHRLRAPVSEALLLEVLEAATRALRPAPVALAAPAAAPSPPSSLQAPRPAAPPPEAPTEQRALRHLKVEVGRVDALMDLAGELIVAKNALPYLARRARELYAVPALAKELMGQYAVINRICEELQGAVMQVRMMSVGHAFDRFPRLVRELSRRQGKQVRLLLEGQETEADKTIVEDLAEPLVHLVRNAIDHGLEAPEERTAAGKPAEATLRLSATPSGDRVQIVVRDDGRGIDPARIRLRAFQRGLIDEAALESLSDEEAIQLIFTPGFSTADTVSDLSGRGVGMDVVRTMVGRSGGAVSVSSTIGAGTTITLALPLSMAISRIMMVEAADQLFGIPMNTIRETTRIPKDAIRRIKGREGTILRSRLMPVYRLRSLLALEDRPPQDEEYALIIEIEGEEAVLIVDRLSEGMDVILKPMVGLMEGLPLYRGTTMLGDGRILLVLDMEEILRCH